MSEKIKFYKGTEANLPTSGIEIGALYHCEDTGNTYRGISAIELELFSSAVGKKTLDSGEIFNDYVNNTTIPKDGVAILSAHAEGEHTSAGWRSHAEGYLTIANSTSHAEGRLARAVGKASHAEGYEWNIDFTDQNNNTIIVLLTQEAKITDNYIVVNTIPEGLAEGDVIFVTNSDTITMTPTDSKVVTKIEGNTITLHAPFIASNYLETGHVNVNNEPILPIGAKVKRAQRTQAIGNGSHAEGRGTTALADCTHAEGVGTITGKISGYDEDNNPIYDGQWGHAEGYMSQTTGDAAHAEGSKSIASNTAAHSEGQSTLASGVAAHAEGEHTQAIGSRSHSEGYRSTAYGSYSHSEGRGTAKYTNDLIANRTESTTADKIQGAWNDTDNKFNIAYGSSSHVEGQDCIALANYSHAEGYRTQATGSAAHAEGGSTKALNETAHAEGQNSQAVGKASHAEGSNTRAVGNYSHAGGYHTIANGRNQTVIGQFNDPNGDDLFIIGNGDTSNRSNILAVNNTRVLISPNGDQRTEITDSSLYIGGEGPEGTSIMPSSIWVGNTENSLHITNDDIVKGENHVLFDNDLHKLVFTNAQSGIYNPLSSDNTIVLVGKKTTGEIFNSYTGTNANEASGRNSHAEGLKTKALGAASHAEGYNTIADGGDTGCAHAEGHSTQANAAFTHAEGQNCIVNSKWGHAEGHDTVVGIEDGVWGWASHAEGNSTRALGDYSHAEGEGSMVESGHSGSHAEGYYTEIYASYAHAEGNRTKVYGLGAHAEGEYTIARGPYSHVQGKYNIADVNGKYAHIVGNGDADNTRSNAHTLDWDGNAWYSGNITSDGIMYMNKTDKIATEKYVTAAITNLIDSSPTALDTLNELAAALGDDPNFATTVTNYIGTVENEVDRINNYLDSGHLQTTYLSSLSRDTSISLTDYEINFTPSPGPKYFNINDTLISTNLPIYIDDDKVITQSVLTSQLNSTLTSQLKSHYVRAGLKPGAVAGEYSTAEGYYTTSSGRYSHAEGLSAIAEGPASHAEGYLTKATGGKDGCAHAEGNRCGAFGFASHAEGVGTRARYRAQHVQGTYNQILDKNYAHIVGNGSSDNDRTNCHWLKWNGDAWYAGTITGTKVYGAVWNDYAEYRQSNITEPGRVICENGDDTLSLATKRLQPGAEIISDTFGFAIGETDTAKTPIAVSGRVLAYTYEDRTTYAPGDAVCAAPNGTVSKMTREEIMMYPERIIGTVSAIPTYETWGTGNVPVNGRIWIKVK